MRQKRPHRRINREIRPPTLGPIPGDHVTQQILIDPAGGHRCVPGTVTTPGTRRQAQVRHPGHSDRRADPIHQIEQRIRPPIETVVHLAPEPAKFTLVTTADLPDTTNNGH
ncbi:hypothetical protein ABZ345_36155 [Lentzea sp. NPDC005914]|uniref:hypothetical protein n=1 Tax=Lentzea sp. NPDC005914 TaxID=3154572 RepID=UPI0034083460